MVTTGDADFARESLVAAAGGRQRAVAVGAGPADRQRDRLAGKAEMLLNFPRGRRHAAKALFLLNELQNLLLALC